MLLPNLIRRSPCSVAFGDTFLSFAQVTLAARSKSISRGSLSCLMMALTQKPLSALGCRMTQSALGASSRTQPSGTENRNRGIPVSIALGCTTTRDVDAAGCSSSAMLEQYRVVGGTFFS